MDNSGQIQIRSTHLRSLNKKGAGFSILFIIFFVVWTQFVLLKFNMPAFLKFMITFILSFALSWLTGILLRKIKLFRLYL